MYKVALVGTLLILAGIVLTALFKFLSSLQLGRANSEEVQDHEMYSGVYVMLHSHSVNLPIAVLHAGSNFNVATLCKLRSTSCVGLKEFALRSALVMLVHSVLPIVSMLFLLIPIIKMGNEFRKTAGCTFRRICKAAESKFMGELLHSHCAAFSPN